MIDATDSAWQVVPRRTRTVLLAGPRSFCAGVVRAIDVVIQLLDRHGGPIYVRKQIVHNAHVVEDLTARGARFVDELDEVPQGARVVFSAHGVSPSVRAEAARRGLDTVDATCPLVAKVHSEARRYAARGDTIVLIGEPGHDEVEGVRGVAPHQTVVVRDAAEVTTLDLPASRPISYLTQTTLAADETAGTIDSLRRRFPEARGPASEDICYAATNRQEAVKAIADEADLVLVVGSANSHNSGQLVEVARRRGVPAHLIDDAGAIRPEWLVPATVVGVTAGASAPPHLVTAVVDRLADFGPVTVTEREVVRESVEFTLPSPLRP